MGSTTTARALLKEGLRPETPADRMRRAILSRMSELAREGVKESEIRQSLFPHTILDDEILSSTLGALLAGQNLLLVGPTGAGKTTLAKDVWELYPKEVFAVEGCPVQDDPFSLVDPSFSRLVPPCPYCKANYGKEAMREVGDFDPHHVDPGDVPVVRFRLREGRGFSRIQGSPEVFPDYLTGAINLSRLEEVGDPESPLVLEPGKIMQANRGILLVDEIGKLPRGTQNVLLQALQERIVTPAKSRETFPASFMAVTTSNLDDLDHITEPLVGRLAGIHVRFNEEPGKNLKILHLALGPDERIPRVAREVVVEIVERFRKFVEGVPELSEAGSNRTMIDIARRAESLALLSGSPTLRLSHLYGGALEAMQGRVRARSSEGFRQNRDIVQGFLAKNFKATGAEAAEAYWCRFFSGELKEDRGEGQRTVAELRALIQSGRAPPLEELPPKARRFVEWVVREDAPGTSDPSRYALDVFRFLEESGIFEGKK